MLFPLKIKSLFFSFALFYSFFIYTNDEANKAATFNNNNSPTTSPIYNTEIKPQFITNTTSFINAIGIKISDITVLVNNFVKETVTEENYTLLKKLIKQILWENRYKITGGTLLGSYSAASFLLLVDYYRMDQAMFWARWKEQLSFEDLCTIPQSELARELMLAIGHHHYNKINPTDLAYPLVTFIKEIDDEINIIKRYITTTKIIKRLRLMLIFPTSEHKITQATKMLERTLFIKHIFLSWLADYNLTMTQKVITEIQ